jgi:hypothetical protein
MVDQNRDISGTFHPPDALRSLEDSCRMLVKPAHTKLIVRIGDSLTKMRLNLAQSAIDGNQLPRHKLTRP